MPTVHANDIDIYYEVQGDGEPLVLIPYLAADQACYTFQVADYAKHFSCFTVDLRGAGRSSQPAPIRPNCSPTTSLRSCGPLAWTGPTSRACH